MYMSWFICAKNKTKKY